MFFNEDDKKKAAEKAVEAKAFEMMMDYLAERLLESESVPEKDKLGVKIVIEARAIEDALQNLVVEKYAAPESEASAEVRREVLEYLGLVRTGLIQFSESTPIEKGEVNNESDC